MSQPGGKQLYDHAQLLPEKDTLTALKSDVTLESACLELCDNSLDAWKRTSGRRESATITISVDDSGDATSLTIRDDAGGVPRRDAAMLFGLGQTAKSDVSGSIGTYGVGAKKSLVNLGVPFQISSCDQNTDIGWSYRITSDWFEDDDDWTVPVYEKRDIDPGVTEIKIEDLNYEWDEETAANLRSKLGEAYNLFLSDDMQELHRTDYDLTITVDGKEVEPEGLPEWSYSKFDGIHPRRYQDIQLSNDQLSEPVTLHITVGLLQKKDSQQAGTDIYCQKRKIASSLRDDVGGFGTGKDRLGNFSSRHERLKVILELETDADGQKLPWDTQKSTIDKHNPIMRGTSDSRGVYNWVRRTVSAYFQLDADKVSQAFLEPYDATSEHSYDQIECLDYNDRKRVVSIHRPDVDIPQVKAIQQKAKAHALYKIRSQSDLDDWQLPAYKIQLEREVGIDFEELTYVHNPPSKEKEENVHEEVGRINKLAHIHYENGIYYPDNLAPWQKPVYAEYMDRHGASFEMSEVSANSIPTIPSEIAEIDSIHASQNGIGPVVHSAQTIEEDQAESAEIFLVLGNDSDNERGAKVFELPRNQLCEAIGLSEEVGDDVLWEEVEHRFQQFLEMMNSNS